MITESNIHDVNTKVEINCPNCARDVNEAEMANMACGACGTSLSSPSQSVTVTAKPLILFGSVA